MRRWWTWILAAAVTGLLAGVVTAIATGGGAAQGPGERSGPSTGLLRRETGPARTALPGVLPPRPGGAAVPSVYPHLAGRRPRVVATVADPYGGPRWAVRTFRRPNIQVLPGPRRVRRGTVTCAQVGRVVDGRFAWVHPGKRRALRVPVRTTDNTVCRGGGRGASIGVLHLPVGRAGASLPTAAATVLWGLSRRAGASVALRTRSGVRTLPDRGAGTRLTVVRGGARIGRAQVRVDGRGVRRGLDNQPFFGGLGGSPSVALDGLRVVGVAADPSSDRPKLVAVAGRGRERCWGTVPSLLDGEPIRVVTALGALAPAAASCQAVWRVRPGTWTQLGGSAGTDGQQPTAERRRQRERRVMPGYAETVIGVPDDVTELDVADASGVRTVRTIPVGPARLAVVLRAGDLPLASMAASRSSRRVVLVGRTAAGRTVRLRHATPVVP
ncbi:hypothetical protein ACVU7I_01705 [Patulibacter sp. S7RM1-6]